MPARTRARPVRLPALLPGQQAVFDHPARFQVAACGRRWGKTRLGVAACVAVALQGGDAWWVGPTYPVASIGWRMLRTLCLQLPGVELREGDRRALLPTGGSIEVRSASDPDSLRGEGLDLAVLDEAAYQPEAAWTQALRPALADRRGRALFLSTPRGRNWFYRLYLRGQDPAEPAYASWNLPTASNPTIPADELVEARRSMPDRWFRQEFLAEFLDDAAGVFRGVRAAIRNGAVARADAQNPAPAFVGVDWGQAIDYTVLTAIQDGHVVALDRFNGLGWELQFGRLRAFCDRLRPALVLLEQNSMGGPLVERAQRELGWPCAGFTTTAQSKRALIDDLALGIETGEITYPELPELVNELEAFEYTTLPTGAQRLAAGAGAHDDCVMSLALALRASRVWRRHGSFADAGGYDTRPVGPSVTFRRFG